MNITVIGAGYVGLVTAACFAEMGNQVICLDNDSDKVDKLNSNIVPIHEPGLEPMIIKGKSAGLLEFTTDFKFALEAEIYFIATGTPPCADGSADLSSVIAVAEQIGQHLSRYAVIVSKSTVPVGTSQKIRHIISKQLEKRNIELAFDVVSNPEFLKQGDAVADFMRPERIIVGTDSERAATLMKKLYRPFSRNHDKLQIVSTSDAEMTKYAANAMLATKISFINEIANLCDRFGVNVENVRKGIGSDSRIGYSFIYPGCGYGGSCFPKDVKALIHMGEKIGFIPELLMAVDKRNTQQKRYLVEQINNHFNHDLTGKVFAVWGLAFKPETDDMREAPALTVIADLVEAGAMVQAHDPMAMDNAKDNFLRDIYQDNKIRFCDNQYEVLEGCNALILLTEWHQYCEPDFILLKNKLKNPVIFDGRNQYSPVDLSQNGFIYYSIGRSRIQ